MSGVIPIIDSITELNGLFYAKNKEGGIIFVTEYQEIATIYFAVPEIVKQQAARIVELNQQLTQQEEAQNQAIMEIIPCGSHLIH